MEHIKLKLLDTDGQKKLETVFKQLGWKVTRRTVCEDAKMPPTIAYQLEGAGKLDRLAELIPQFGYGFSRDPKTTTIGEATTINLTVRQLFPTVHAQKRDVRRFGEGGDE